MAVRFNWEKLGNIFAPGDENFTAPWMTEFAQAPNTLVFEDFVRVYFCTRPPKDESGQYVSHVGYFDFDPRDLSVISISPKPQISLGGLGHFDEFGTYPFSPLQVEQTFYAAYGGWTRLASVPFDVSIGLAMSKSLDEGFTKVNLGPMISKSLWEPFVLSSPKLRYFENKYYLFYIAGSSWIGEVPSDPIYSIRMAISADLKDWEKENRNLVPNIVEDEAQASPDVFYENGLYHMFFCFRYGKDFRNDTRSYRMGYAYSTDLINWERDDLMSNLGCSESGWDSSSVSYPHVFQFKDEIYMLYTGNGIGKTGIGIAKRK